MAGLIVFKSLEEAERNGYQPFDRTSNGYLVRTRTDAGWAMAIVDLTKRRSDDSRERESVGR